MYEPQNTHLKMAGVGVGSGGSEVAEGVKVLCSLN